ncbi:MAG TPA: hypothetical protein PKK12_02555 [Candidatus Aminicenantes bacterium]|nr:hypothetical protein [Candidatus Aminicenantes bacterium]
MKLKEEKEIQQITDEFAKAMAVFSKHDYAKARGLFDTIVENYRNSDSYSVQEIHARAKVYLSIVESRLHPVKVELKTREDFLWEATFQLNAGKLDQAATLFAKIAKESGDDPNYHFLTAILRHRLGDDELALTALAESIRLDKTFKVLAANEPDLTDLAENPQFLKLVE